MERPHRTFHGIMSVASFDRHGTDENETKTDNMEVNNE
jgi:hypothetical protein